MPELEGQIVAEQISDQLVRRMPFRRTLKKTLELCRERELPLFFVNQPISKLIRRTRLIAKGDYRQQVPIRQNDEIGLLGDAIDTMWHDITEKQTALNKQRDEYMDLFQRVPCLITVQDTEFKLLRYNREFAHKFGPRPGDRCYEAYKGRSQKCESCPVEKTFADGQTYSTEETGMDKDGSIKHWIVRSSPIFDENGELVAAMEISLDITERKLLEVELEQAPAHELQALREGARRPDRELLAPMAAHATREGEALSRATRWVRVRRK